MGGPCKLQHNGPAHFLIKTTLNERMGRNACQGQNEGPKRTPETLKGYIYQGLRLLLLQDAPEDAAQQTQSAHTLENMTKVASASMTHLRF